MALVAPPASAAEGTRFRPAVSGDGGVVASVSPLAAAAGLEILDAGGNAIDAAAATIFAVGVVRPELCGIGGGGFLLYRGADGTTAALDFREESPAAHEHSGGVPEGGRYQSDTGHNRVGVPGVVAGIAAALKRFGTMKLSDVIGPAEDLARNGFPVSPDLSLGISNHADRMKLFPETAETFLVGGSRPYLPGEILVLPDYADSLALIAQGGPRAFYRGSIAAAIAADMEASGTYEGDRGFMALADLHAYKAVWRAPLIGTYRGHDVITMPPPTSGGVATLEMLNLLEGYDLAGMGQSSADHLHYVTETQKMAFADREAYLGDPDHVSIPVEMLTSKTYAAQRRAEITSDAKDSYPAGGEAEDPSAPLAAVPGQTTHVSVIDAAGNAVSVTCSVEVEFGSAVIAPGTGFVLNSQLDDFGAEGTPNAPAGNKRPRSSMSPTIVVHDDRPLLVTGAAGGSLIIAGVVQAIVNVVDFGLGIAQALDAERVEGSCPPALCVEWARLRPTVLIELADRGHPVNFAYCAFHLQWAGPSDCDEEYHPWPQLQAAGITGEGRAEAVSDPRGEWGSAAQ